MNDNSGNLNDLNQEALDILGRKLPEEINTMEEAINWISTQKAAREAGIRSVYDLTAVTTAPSPITYNNVELRALTEPPRRLNNPNELKKFTKLMPILTIANSNSAQLTNYFSPLALASNHIELIDKLRVSDASVLPINLAATFQKK